MFTLLDIVQVPDSLGVNADSVKVAFRGMAEAIAQNPHEFLSQMLEHAIGFGLKLVAAIVIYAVGAWLIKKVKQMQKRFFARRGTEQTLTTFVISLTSITLTVLLLIVTIGALGVNTTSFAAVLAAGGMAIGMALSGTVQNFAGGLMILLFKPFKVGDYIKALGYEGTVSEVSMVSTKIRTYANSIIILPNGTLFNGNIDNFSEKPLHRCQWIVGVAYGSETEKVRSVVMGILGSDSRILNSQSAENAPEPSVNLTDLKDSAVEFTIRAWVKTEDYWSVLYSVNEKIYAELPKNGIQFPFPQIDVHMLG